MAVSNKAIIGVEDKAKEREEHPETLLANQVSILDFARKNNFVITYEDNKIAKIQDVVSEEDITVFKGNNTWSVPENGNTTGGRTIRFVARMQEMTNNAASDMLVENWAKYKSSKEYNDEYAKQHSKQVEEKSESIVQKEEAVKKQEGSQEKVQEEENDNSLPARFSKQQAAEIIAGAKRGLDIKVYDKIELSPVQMREIRIGLENDVNLSKFAYKQVSADYMREVRLAAQDGLDLKAFALKKKECVYNAEQAREIRLGLKFGLNQEQIKVFAKKNLEPDVMREIRLGLQEGLDSMSDFNSGLYTAKDIHTVRMHLLVKQFIQSLKQKISILFEQVKKAIESNLQKQKPDMSAKEVTEETELQIKDTVKDLYEAIEESIAEKTIEDKKEILAGVFEKVVAIGNAIEQIYPDKEKAEAFHDAASQVVKTINDNTSKERTLNALKVDYAERFSENEQKHNVKIVEIAEELMNEPITEEQKKEILMNNLNYEIGEAYIEILMEHIPHTVLPDSVQPVQEKVMNQYQQNIIEHFQDFGEFEMEQ